jgi:hypothetical protein
MTRASINDNLDRHNTGRRLIRRVPLGNAAAGSARRASPLRTVLRSLPFSSMIIILFLWTHPHYCCPHAELGVEKALAAVEKESVMSRCQYCG